MSNFPRKPESQSGPRRTSEIITPSQVTFVGEQTSPADDELKDHIRHLFEKVPRVCRRIYLARVSYGDPSICTVVLCFRIREEFEEILQKDYGHMFSAIHRSGDSYDVMKIGEEQELELRKVCKPFYEAV